MVPCKRHRCFISFRSFQRNERLQTIFLAFAALVSNNSDCRYIHILYIYTLYRYKWEAIQKDIFQTWHRRRHNSLTLKILLLDTRAHCDAHRYPCNRFNHCTASVEVRIHINQFIEILIYRKTHGSKNLKKKYKKKDTKVKCYLHIHIYKFRLIKTEHQSCEIFRKNLLGSEIRKSAGTPRRAGVIYIICIYGFTRYPMRERD